MDTSALSKSLPAVKRTVSILDKPLSKGKGEVRPPGRPISRQPSASRSCSADLVIAAGVGGRRA